MRFYKNNKQRNKQSCKHSLHKSIQITIASFLLATPTQALFAEILPSEFKNNLVYLTPTLTDGTKIRFYTDTGGGWNVISQELFDKYQWPSIEKASKRGPVKLSSMPNFSKGKAIPKGGLNNFMEGHLFIAPSSKIDDGKLGYDGFLGGRWHAEKIININYPEQQFAVLDQLPKSSARMEALNLGFQKDQHGNYTTAFPRMPVTVDGQSLDLLLDTGAQATLSSKAKSIIDIAGNTMAASFMVASVFDQWRAKHPEWKYIEAGDDYIKEAMIQVPEIKIATFSVGPVWFARRTDDNFHKHMSAMMDKKIDGALGGSAFQYLNMIIDYPAEKLYLEKAN
ncbi:hypothetical protein [uncultured Pseudoteredinibacter sp.]|uniref:hypothetical protein n=1 Tax=uncultured Pseudoteredinibacter sp. TaxID=1641701 RepID=UPI0026171AF1|nr:hypothetical protein [uncultured Pseudoteredinibacter sp.]